MIHYGPWNPQFQKRVEHEHEPEHEPESEHVLINSTSNINIYTRTLFLSSEFWVPLPFRLQRFIHPTSSSSGTNHIINENIRYTIHRFDTYVSTYDTYHILYCTVRHTEY